MVGSPGPGRSPIPSCSTTPVDVLVPAALENQITAANPGRVQAKLVSRGEWPHHPDAEATIVPSAASP